MPKISEIELGSIFDSLRKYCQKHNVLKAIVFGSYARNTASRKSDLDLILIMETKERFFRRYDGIADIYDHLKGLSADILIYTSEEFSRMADRPFIKKAVQEGIVVYERREK